MGKWAEQVMISREAFTFAPINWKGNANCAELNPATCPGIRTGVRVARDPTSAPLRRDADSPRPCNHSHFDLSDSGPGSNIHDEGIDGTDDLARRHKGWRSLGC